MSYPIFRVPFDGPLTVSRREVLRYMRSREGVPEVEALADEAIAAVGQVLTCRACFGRFPVRAEGTRLDLGFAGVESRSLAERLAGCREVLAFAATLGSGVDRLIARSAALSPAEGYAADAAATAAIEAFCDRLCDCWREQMAGEGLTLRERFSAGYGDCPLELQKPLIAALDAPRQIGVSLTDQLLMTPMKSVTALIGLSREGEPV